MKRPSPLEATPPPSKILKHAVRNSNSSSFSSPRPLAEMMATWKRLIVDEEVVCGSVGDGEKVDVKEDSPLPPTPENKTEFSPFDKCGNTLDQCVAEHKEKIKALQKKWADEDQIRAEEELADTWFVSPSFFLLLCHSFNLYVTAQFSFTS